MMKIAILGVLAASATAFTTPSLSSVQTSSQLLRMTGVAPADVEETFYQAVQMAEKGQQDLNLDEMDRLATELEKFKGCAYETGNPEETISDLSLCEKEIQDRLDVAEILRMQIELQLRLDYLKKANLFADDVKKEHDAIERKKFKDSLIANREKAPGGSDLGLW